ncbi:MAG: hypothetical protein K5873_08135 [Treponema sp.]|nr:hypothetical protein [Treponema sp.]
MSRNFPSAAVTQPGNPRSLWDWLRHCSIAGALLLFNLIFSLPVFAGQVISPVKGTFSNRQSLVLDLSEGEEAFYSYSSSDPLSSGFAYDSPVLIDTAGFISLRIAIVKGEAIQEFKIDYQVNENGNPFATGTAEKAFIDRVLSENILTCSSENIIEVPKGLTFSIGDGEKPLMRALTLAVSPDNKLSRYIPCTLETKNSRWRFIIFLKADQTGSEAESDLPFEFSDWETFTFTGKNLIWCLDDGLWSASKKSIKIDRSKKHTLYYQDVDYKAGNTIYSFEIPTRPQIKKDNFDGAQFFSIQGDLRYRFSLINSGAEGAAPPDKSLYQTMTFDTFYGDYVKGKALFAIYCDGLYQGELTVPYEIDRQPPLPPKFLPSEPGNYARKDVKLRVSSEKDAEIYLCLSGPYTVSSNSYLDNNSEFDYITPDEFFLYKSQNILLRAGVEKTVCYKAFAYAKDKAGNVSSTASYQVIIDEFNYFIDGGAPSFAADGSRLHPYNSFDQVTDVINQGKFVHFFVSGNVYLPAGKTEITSNSSFTGLADARIIFSPSSYVLVKDSSVEFQNCVLEKELPSSGQSDSRFMIFERAAASFEDCEIFASFSDDAYALSGETSIVNFKNSGLTVKSSGYALGVSGNNSRISLEKSRVSVISDTSVNFSLKGGSFELDSSECSLISHLGRVIEACGVNLRLKSNTYRGDFSDQKKKILPVWTDEKCLILEDKNNISQGF